MRENQKKISDFENLGKIKNEYEKAEMSKEQIEKMKERMQEAKREKKNGRYPGWAKAATAVAAAAAVFIALPNTSESIAYAMSNIPLLGGLVQVVTFRDYQYANENNNASIHVPELAAGENIDIAGTEDTEDSQAQENLKKSTAEINQEIQTITDNLVREFEDNLAEQDGQDGMHQSVYVNSEVVATTDRYFTLKLMCFQAAGSGSETDYYYTIDLTTGERLALADLFKDGADYITPISDEIKRQMREQMKDDENVMYWVDNTEMPEWNFTGITDETSFYINENGNIVISFNEGDVAPMCMGVVTFEIPSDVVAEILK